VFENKQFVDGKNIYADDKINDKIYEKIND